MMSRMGGGGVREPKRTRFRAGGYVFCAKRSPLDVGCESNATHTHTVGTTVRATSAIGLCADTMTAYVLYGID